MRIQYKWTLIHWRCTEKVTDDLGKNRFSGVVKTDARLQRTQDKMENEETEPAK